MNELLQIFNKTGTILKPVTFRQALKNPHVYYGVCSIWLIDNKGRILCSKRSQTSLLDPGRWQSFFGGKLRAGEGHEQAAVRELQEEIGLKISTNQLAMIDTGFINSSHRYYKAYAVRFTPAQEKEIKPNSNEISDLCW